MGGKSTRLYEVIHIKGKPYREQGKIGTKESFVLAYNVRVCRIDRWLSIVVLQQYRIRLMVRLAWLLPIASLYGDLLAY